MSRSVSGTSYSWTPGVTGAVVSECPTAPGCHELSRAPLEPLLRRLFPWKSLNKIYTSLSLSLWWVGRLPYCSSRVHLAYFPLLVHLWLKDYLCMLFFWSSFSYFKTLLPCSSMFWLCTSGLSGERWLCHHLNGMLLSAGWASLSPMKSRV